MTSKNSFWVSLKENNKRRIWLWILSAFTYLVVLPTVTAMFISSYKTNNSYLIEQYGESAGMERIRQETMNQLLKIFNGDNLLLLVIISGVAIVSGIQGFSYLYHKNKIDFYQAAPVKQSRRFLTIWLNGVLVYLIPGFAGTVLCLLVMAGNQMLTAEILQQTGITFFLLLFVYLGCYHMTILAVMLTGNVLITCLGTGVFFLYEWMVRSVLSGYKLLFFHIIPHLTSRICRISLQSPCLSVTVKKEVKDRRVSSERCCSFPCSAELCWLLHTGVTGNVRQKQPAEQWLLK